MWLASRPWLEFTLVSIALIIDGIFGAWLSTRIRAQTLSFWFTFLSGNISILVWAYLTKYSHMKLVAASLFFDIVYNVAWMLALIYFGEHLSGFQLLGVFLVMIGIGLFSIGGQ